MNEDRSNQEQQVNIMTSLTPEEAVAIVKEAVNVAPLWLGTQFNVELVEHMSSITAYYS